MALCQNDLHQHHSLLGDGYEQKLHLVKEQMQVLNGRQVQPWVLVVPSVLVEGQQKHEEKF